MRDLEYGADGKEAESNDTSETCTVSYDLLEVAFQVGTEVWYESNGQQVGGVVTEVAYEIGCGGEIFRMDVQSISCDGKRVVYSTKEKTINKFLNTRPIDELPVHRMTQAIKASLSKRGRLFRKYCIGKHHLQYSGIGFMDWPSRKYASQNEFGNEEFGFQTFRADGRVMIDAAGFVRFNATYLGGRLPPWAMRLDEDDTEITKADFSDNELWKCLPTVKGFSFKSKRWGEFLLDGLSPICYRSDAIHSLVMPPDRKEMVLALVEHASSSFMDIVDEKGGGCVFLLHGPPGVGKTLTAEATAETLKRPLYSITVGELGSSVESMESRLKFTLELTRLWDAVLLIDECDIFLEARGSDIHRNAMTGIFLRLLEYHQGILFMTSNRIKKFDPALHSRITVALYYPALDQAARAEVWRSMLSAAGFDSLDFNINELAADEANGRQIKNAVRFAQVMARRQKVNVALEHCQLASKLAREFDCADGLL